MDSKDVGSTGFAAVRSDMTPAPAGTATLVASPGITRPTDAVADAFETAVAEVAATTTRLLAELPPRRQPPKTMPPLRRPEVRARLAR